MFDFFDRWIKSVDRETTAGGTEAQLRRSRFICIVATVLLAASAGVSVVAFALHSRPINKRIDAAALVLALSLIPILWQFYFWIKRQVLEKSYTAAIK